MSYSRISQSGMGPSGEVIVGEVPVVSRLALGSERLRLVLTSNRLIVAHVGKRGLGAAATSNILGAWGSALESLFKGGRESSRSRRMKELTPQDILGTDKDNFYIGYEEIVSVDVGETGYLTSITLLTQKDKFEFSTALALDDLVQLLRKGLGSKLNVSKAR